jgi:phosphoserine aminotransferase
MPTKRVYNFNPGPAALPLEVLQQAQAEMLDYKGSGMSVNENFFVAVISASCGCASV